MRIKTIILGAMGRDYHNFNMIYRDNSNYEVVAFTATQIPGISERVYPKELAGRLYAKGIPIHKEGEIPRLIKKFKVDEVVFAYSDVDKEHVMKRALLALSLGANFKLLGPKETMLGSKRPVIAVSASRTGAGKSTVVQRIIDILKPTKIRFVAIRHAMPYGNLKKEIVQRFTKIDDLVKQKCTIEEIEEYLPYIKRNVPIYSGVDYEKILKEAEKEAELIIFECGNNDFPFIKPDLWIAVVDPLRPEGIYSYPGEVNIRNADIIIINKGNLVSGKQVNVLKNKINQLNKKAIVIKAKSEITVDKPELIKNKKVLVIEDSPSVTHGSLGYAAGYVGAKRFGAKEMINPRRYAVGYLKKIYEEYKHLKNVLPSLGYTKKQLKELERTINRIRCDSVVLGTPADLSILIRINKPIVHISYKLRESGNYLKNSILVFTKSVR